MGRGINMAVPVDPCAGVACGAWDSQWGAKGGNKIAVSVDLSVRAIVKKLQAKS